VAEPQLREERAQQILDEKRREYQDVSRSKAVLQASLGATNVVDALDVALRLKCASDREHTKITYTSFRNIFCEWLTGRGWQHLPVSAMDRAKANAYLDYVLLERRTRDGSAVGSRTYNNYIINMRALFYELVKREYLAENPFANMKPRKEEQKLRQPFQQDDSDRIAAYVYRQNRPIYLAILLISHCGMRISELRRLRARDIDLQRGLIVLGGNQTKNKERAFITIPAVALDSLRAFGLEKTPGNHLVFGIGLKPHPKMPVGRNTISDRFREMLRAMVKAGLLASAEGYTAYSWKDTGALAMVRAGLDIVAIQRHLRHKSLATTQRYLQSLGVVNREVRDFKGVIFKLPGEIAEAA
jgi:integrase